MTRRKYPLSRQGGFTLLEIIVVLAVLGALAAMLSPVVFRYLDDANTGRAQADAAALASAINKMYKDTGRWPFYADGDGALSYTSGTDVAILTSNASCTGGTCTDSTVPTDGTSNSWALGSAVLDNMGNHLVLNTPKGSSDSNKKYLNSGARAWKGPYVDRIPTLDPWGRSFVVNISNADPGVAEGSQKWVLVVSAGPDGELDTSATTSLFSNANAGGDDVVARVK